MLFGFLKRKKRKLVSLRHETKENVGKVKNTNVKMVVDHK